MCSCGYKSEDVDDTVTKKNAERDFFSGIKGAAKEMRDIKRM